MGFENLEEHALSPWLDTANDFLLVPIKNGGFETIPIRSVGGGIFEVRCIPFWVYDLDKGDLVRKNADDVLTGIVQKSGDCGFRLRTSAKEETILEMVGILEEHGCTVEFEPSGAIIAVNAPVGTDQERVSGLLANWEDDDILEYETVRLV